MSEPDLRKATDRCYRLLAYRPRTEYELRCKLEKAGFLPPVVDLVITALKEKNLLDDETFARNWVRRRLSTKPVGPGYLWGELQQKGIDKDIIAVALNEYDEESELEAAMQLARKKISGQGGAVNVRRLAGFLTRRGFSGLVVSKVCRCIDEDGRFDLS